MQAGAAQGGEEEGERGSQQSIVVQEVQCGEHCCMPFCLSVICACSHCFHLGSHDIPAVAVHKLLSALQKAAADYYRGPV